MSNPQAAAAMARGGGLLQSVGDGSVVHSEENLVGGTVVQAYVNFTLMMCTHRTFCCFLKWYIEKQGPCHTLKEDSSEPRCFAPPAVFFDTELVGKSRYCVCYDCLHRQPRFRGRWVGSSFLLGSARGGTSFSLLNPQLIPTWLERRKMPLYCLLLALCTLFRVWRVAVGGGNLVRF